MYWQENTGQKSIKFVATFRGYHQFNRDTDYLTASGINLRFMSYYNPKYECIITIYQKAKNEASY